MSPQVVPWAAMLQFEVVLAGFLFMMGWDCENTREDVRPNYPATNIICAEECMSATNETTHKGSLLATPYPTAGQWKKLVEQFSSDAIAHKLLLAHVPYVFKDEPLKFALFRHTIAEAFCVEASNVFIVGSAMAGRSLKGNGINKEYTPGSDSDIDTLIVSESLFTHYVMRSLEWVKEITKPDGSVKDKNLKSPILDSEKTNHVGRLAMYASKGIWRPDSLPKDAPARIDFFTTFNQVSLKTLGLQLSEDTVARVNGRIARTFKDAVSDLAENIRRLKREFGVDRDDEPEIEMEDDIDK